LEGLNVRLIFNEGETARLSGQMSIAAAYKINVDFARLVTSRAPEPSRHERRAWAKSSSQLRNHPNRKLTNGMRHGLIEQSAVQPDLLLSVDGFSSHGGSRLSERAIQ
jgi:hypothetical protein